MKHLPAVRSVQLLLLLLLQRTERLLVRFERVDDLPGLGGIVSSEGLPRDQNQKQNSAHPDLERLILLRAFQSCQHRVWG